MSYQDCVKYVEDERVRKIQREAFDRPAGEIISADELEGWEEKEQLMRDQFDKGLIPVPEEQAPLSEYWLEQEKLMKEQFDLGLIKKEATIKESPISVSAASVSVGQNWWEIPS